MNDKELADLTGQKGAERTPAYKLNEVKLNGDTGVFKLREILGEKGEDGKYAVKELTNKVQGVILKMRWRLFRYEEVPGGKSHTYMTSEYDNKNTDMVVVFGANNEKGIAVEMKEKHQLKTQRVIYAYIPGAKQVVRVIVNASALTGDNNPDGELGLFEYVDQVEQEGKFLHLLVTEFGSVYRQDPNGNKRKDYHAMTFKQVKEIEEENKESIRGMVKEVHEKIGKNFAEEYVPPTEAIETPTEDINPDDIPF